MHRGIFVLCLPLPLFVLSDEIYWCNDREQSPGDCRALEAEEEPVDKYCQGEEGGQDGPAVREVVSSLIEKGDGDIGLDAVTAVDWTGEEGRKIRVQTNSIN